jgi:hypothetical protein
MYLFSLAGKFWVGEEMALLRRIGTYMSFYVIVAR